MSSAPSRRVSKRIHAETQSTGSDSPAGIDLANTATQTAMMEHSGKKARVIDTAASSSTDGEASSLAAGQASESVLPFVSSVLIPLRSSPRPQWPCREDRCSTQGRRGNQ